MKVSVVVPLFNKRETVKRSLASIAAQTFGDFEVVVVDDGSTDGGDAIASGFPDPRFRVIRQANAGPGSARNRGVAESRGELVAFLDADDEWLPQYLETGVELLAGEPSRAAVACAWCDEPGGQTAPWLHRKLLPGLFRATAETPPELLLYTLILFSPCSTIARREVVQRYGGFYSRGCRYGEDAHLWLKVLLNEPVWVNLAPLVKFHRGASSLSGNLHQMRPVEPFLTDPDDIRRVCPAALSLLLDQLLCMRALKTSALLCLWGRREEAARLRKRFLVAGSWRFPWYFTSWVGTVRPFSMAFAVAAAVWRRTRLRGRA